MSRLTVGQANAVQVIANHLTGKSSHLADRPSRREATVALLELVPAAYKTLLTGWRPEDLQAHLVDPQPEPPVEDAALTSYVQDVIEQAARLRDHWSRWDEGIRQQALDEFHCRAGDLDRLLTERINAGVSA